MMEPFQMERYILAKEKLSEILSSESLFSDVCNQKDYEDYQRFFKTQASFLLKACEIYDYVSSFDKPFSGLKVLSADKAKQYVADLYNDITADNYEKSFCNPTLTVSLFGEEVGRIFSLVAYEMRATIPFAYEGKGLYLLIRLELLIEIFCQTYSALEDGLKTPDASNLRDSIYWYVSDYSEDESLLRVSEMVDDDNEFATDIIMNADLSDTDYLYMYGEYITDNEVKLARYIASLPDEKIAKMADTFSEGYRIGFVTTGKDLSKKNTVNIRYPLGLERVVKKAITNFEKMGLKPVIYRAYSSLFRRQNVQKIGFFGANPNMQYDYDHSKDEALCLDGQLVTRKIECFKEAFETYKVKAYGHAGPAVIEIFGEEPFVPDNKKESYKLDKEQQQLSVKQASKMGALSNEYIKGEERSFTIIAFPVPSIGENFEAIFDETLEINTLDYYLYQKLQQNIIDVLDTADSVHIVGMGDNQTDITVKLMEIKNPEKQTKFENCVADVNIPVGEVFTSPVLKGTTGRLNVSEVFLNDLKYENLIVDIADGFVTSYSLTNYDDEEKNKAFFVDNVLFNHDTLPVGEFAIGTNTRAFKMGKDYAIAGKLPILIAEKTGPHFALGDTCYSHAEDVAVYNPDGKEIMPRDNEVSILRKEDPSKAYFNCHTDITLPYNELGLIEAIRPDGSSVKLLENGRFVLDGMEELNKYLD